MRLRHILACLLLIMVPAVSSPSSAGAQPPEKTGTAPAAHPSRHILLIYSGGFYLPAYRKNISAFFEVLERAGLPVHRIHFEQLDLIRQRDPGHRRAMVELLRQKYADADIGLIITVDSQARDLILAQGVDFLPGVPLVAMLAATALERAPASRRVVQIPRLVDRAATLKMALALFPKTSRVLVVAGSGPDDIRRTDEARIQFKPWADKLDFRYTNGLSVADIRQLVASMPPDGIIIYLALFRDGTGRDLAPRDVAADLAKRANAPMFGFYDEILPSLLGGRMLSYAMEGARAARLALEIMGNTFPWDGRRLVTLPAQTLPMFNWLEMRRWGLSAESLPEGAEVINKPHSVWDDYHQHAVAASLLIAGQAGLILALLLMYRRHRRGEAQRREAEALYRRIVDTANEGIWTVDSHLRTTFVNNKICDTLLYTPEEMLGRPVSDFMHPDDLPAFKHDAANHWRGDAKAFERRYIGKDGRIAWMLVSVTPSVNEKGNLIGAFAMLTDITERKHAEAQRARAEAQLRQSQKMEAIGTLAGGIAHDFNNILGAILGYAELARDGAEEGFSDPKDLDQIIAAANRAKKLVRQILSYSRKLEPERTTLDLNNEVRHAMALLESTLPKMIATRLELAADLKPVRADASQLGQVIVNLAANALHAMPEGGTLTISTANVTLEGQTCATCGESFGGQWVALTVHDTGGGIAPEDLSKVFDPFFTTKEVGKGTGLGLSVVHGIIKSHGGHIQCASEPGRGTSFRIHLLPLGQQAPPRPAQAQPGVEPAGGGEGILVVDDEEPLRAMGKRILEAKGYRVITAASGEEALELYRGREDVVDLVLMDLGMPGMGGFKAVKLIRRVNPAVRVVITSGYYPESQTASLWEIGIHGFVAKPFKRVELLSTVRNVLDQAGA